MTNNYITLHSCTVSAERVSCFCLTSLLGQDSEIIKSKKYCKDL